MELYRTIFLVTICNTFYSRTPTIKRNTNQNFYQFLSSQSLDELVIPLAPAILSLSAYWNRVRTTDNGGTEITGNIRFFPNTLR